MAGNPFKASRASRQRTEAFSDGVFAIVITLLVLELKVPRLPNPDVTGLAHSLMELLPEFLSWVVSFVMVCIYWVNHHRLFGAVKYSDSGLMWLNGLFLLTLSFQPFPSALLGAYPGNPLAASFFGAWMCLTGLAFLFLRLYIRSDPGILADHVDAGAFHRASMGTALFGPALYALAAGAAWVHVWISYAIFVLIPVYFVFPRGET